MHFVKPEHQARVNAVFAQVPKNKLGVLFRYAFYDPFEPLDDAMERIAQMSDELVVSALEEALPRAVNHFSYQR